MEVSAALRAARLGAGLSQAALARRARTSQSAIARYESGATAPTLSTLDRLLTACGKRLEEVIASPARRRPRTARSLVVRERDRLLASASRHGIRRVRLFGSAARRTDRAGSDVDLLVDLRPDRSLLERRDVIDPEAARAPPGHPRGRSVVKRADGERLRDIQDAIATIRAHSSAGGDARLRRDALLYNLDDLLDLGHLDPEVLGMTRSPGRASPGCGTSSRTSTSGSRWPRSRRSSIVISVRSKPPSRTCCALDPIRRGRDGDQRSARATRVIQ